MTEGETESCSVCEWAEWDTETHLYVCKGGALWLLAHHRHSQLPNEDFHSIRAQILTRITHIILVLRKSALSVPDTRFSRVSGSTLLVTYMRKKYCSCRWSSVCPPACPTNSSSHFCPTNSVCIQQIPSTHSSGCVDSNHGDGQPSRPRLKWTFPQKTASVPVSDRITQRPVYWWRLCNYVI